MHMHHPTDRRPETRDGSVGANRDTSDRLSECPSLFAAADCVAHDLRASTTLWADTGCHSAKGAHSPP